MASESVTLYVNVRDYDDNEVMDEPFDVTVVDSKDPLETIAVAITIALGDGSTLDGVYVLEVWKGPNRTGSMVAGGGIVSVAK